MGDALGFLRLSTMQILQVPGVVTMTVAATRMYRSLVDFANESSNAYAINH